MRRVAWASGGSPGRGPIEPGAGLPVAEIEARYGPGIRLSAGSDPLAPGASVLIVESAGRTWLGAAELDQMIDALARAKESYFGRDDA